MPDMTQIDDPASASRESDVPETAVPPVETPPVDSIDSGTATEAATDAGATSDEALGDDPTGGEATDGEPVEAAAAVPELDPEERHALNVRLVEALLFASAQPLSEAVLADRLPEGTDLAALLAELAEDYAPRGVNLVKAGNGYLFRTAPDLARRMKIETQVTRKLSRASVETLAIIAYHQPVTRAEIEQIRGVSISKGTLDFLFEQTWIRPMGRRRAPGKPVTWGTTEFFLEHFGLASLDALPGIEELKAAGLLDARAEVAIYRPDEPDLPLTDEDDASAEPLQAGEEPPVVAATADEDAPAVKPEG